MTMLDNIGAVILAGGLSRRMGGGDKTLLEIAGRPMLGQVIQRMNHQVSRLVLNANGDPDRFAAFGLPVVADPVSGFAGPLAGVLAGLQHFRSHAPDVTHVISVAGDTPFFPDDLAKRLVSSCPPGGIVLAESAGRVHPVFGLWPISATDDLERFLIEGESRKVLAFVDRHPNATTAFEAAEDGLDPFFNINTPDDIQTAEAHLGGRPAALETMS